jgi:1-acyl-sn-glycerol-3-phosphate acyltransferase
MKRALGTARIILAGLYTIVVAIITILSHPFDHRRGRIYHAIGRFWGRGILRICGLPLTTRGADRLERGQTYVYVSNHASLFDIPAVLAGCPGNVRIVYKKELEKIPIFGWCLKWGAYIAIDRASRTDAMRSVEEAARKIREGDSVLLFAEGTRTTDGNLQPFKRGAFNLAVRAGVPVVPLTINGTFTILRKGSFAVTSGPVELVLGTPITVNPDGGREEELRVMQAVHAALAEHYHPRT